MLETTTHGPITRIRMARVVLGRVVHDVSAYLVGGLLVDTGPPATADTLVALCRRREVRRVVLTHHHEDHSGGAAALARQLGVDVLAPAGAIPILAEGLRMPFYRYLVWGQRPERLRACPLPDRIEIGDLELSVLSTPGHAFPHVCLFEAERRWLFSGDLFVHERVKYLRRIEDLEAHLASLGRALALEPELLLCAHAGVVEDACGALERKIAYWEGLRARARNLQAEGYSPAAITRQLLGREGFLTYASFGDFSKRNLVRALLGGQSRRGRGGGP